MQRDRLGWFERGLLGWLAGLFALSVILLGMLILNPQPLQVLGLQIDRLNSAVSLLVAGVGAVVYRFALRYLDGEQGQTQFLRWLAVTVSAAYLLMFAANVVLLFGVWLLTSVGLHRLLTFYPQRAAVHAPARKKFLISRLGDLALLAAFAVIFWQWGTLDLPTFLAQWDAPRDWAFAPHAVGLLVVLAALTKSAQFPFHSWLPETMEAPTPVSALMHAGIINAGGVLLLHFAPLLVQIPLALGLLVLVGTLTAALGMLAMWAQPDVKRALAWSTVSQMGFMMVQFGLAAFPAATLHLIGHGCYKAWAFLRSGDLDQRRATAPTLSLPQRLGLAALGTVIALPALGFAAQLTGFDPLHSPGELALTGVVALSIGQYWVIVFQLPRRSTLWPRLGLAGLATILIALLTLGLYAGAIQFFGAELSALMLPDALWAWLLAAFPVVVFTLLSGLYLGLPWLRARPFGRALWVAALHGFYVGVIVDRIVARIWPQARLKVTEVEYA